MSFDWPVALAGLVAIPLFVGLYTVAGRRRRRSAARFASPALIPNLVPYAPGWRRHVPAAFAIAALGLLVVGIARPHVVRDVTRDEATVVLTIDVSRSMAANDVEPRRRSGTRSRAPSTSRSISLRSRRSRSRAGAPRRRCSCSPMAPRQPVTSARVRLHSGRGGSAYRSRRWPSARATRSSRSRDPAASRSASLSHRTATRCVSSRRRRAARSRKRPMPLASNPSTGSSERVSHATGGASR